MKKGRIDILRAGLAVAGAFALVVFPAAGNANAAIGNIVVTSAASFEPGVPAKGSIATIFCTGLEGISGTVAAQSTPLPRELAGVRVRVGGAEAPIFAVASMPGYQQINIQVPQEAAIELPSAWPAGDNEAWVDVVVEQGARRASVRVAMRKAAGDFFELGDGFAILQHASDYSLVTRDNPARPEEDLIAYLTGMLGTFPEVPTGMPSPSDPPATVPSRGISFSEHGIDLRLSVNSVTALSYGFIGLTPGLVGVYQINFKLREQELLFLYHPLTLFETELRLIRTYCPTGGGCHPTTVPRFYSKWVRIPIAPKK